MQQTTQDQSGNSYTAAQQREEQQRDLASLAVDVGVDVARMLLEESSMVPTVREGNILFRFVDNVLEEAA